MDLSIVIPVYNGELTIQSTISSARAVANGLNAEIIIVNDGSTDTTRQLIHEEIVKDSSQSIKLIDKLNTGVSNSRNEGFSNATGKSIIFLDADDCLDPASVYKQVELLQKDQSLIGVAGKAIFFEEDQNIILKERKGISGISDFLHQDLGYSSCPSGYVWNRNELVSGNIYFDEMFQSAADKIFLIDVLSKGTIAHLADTFFYYRINSSSMSNLITPKLIGEKVQYAKEIKNKLSYLDSNEAKAYRAKQYYAASGMSVQIRKYLNSIKFLSIALIVHPKQTIKLLIRKSSV